MSAMAVEVKKLDVRSGDVVEIDGRRYDVVPDKQGGLTLEPAITASVQQLHDRHGTRPPRRRSSRSCSGICPQIARADPCRQLAVPDGRTCASSSSGTCGRRR